MFARLLVAAGALAFVVAGAQAGDDKDKTNLEGSWKVVKAYSAGKNVEDFKGAFGTRVEFKDGRVTTYGADDKVLHVATYKVNTEKAPFQIDMKAVEGANKDKTMQGIVAVKDDVLRIIYTLAEGKRPSAFTPLEQNEAIMLELQREKK